MIKTLQAKAREALEKTSEVINDNLWYVNPNDLNDIIASTIKEFGEEVLKIIDEQDPSTSRTTSPIYWGNSLRKAIRSLTETV